MVVVYKCLFGMLFVVIVQGLSTHNKTDHMKYHKFYEWSAHPLTACKDKLEKGACSDLKGKCHMYRSLEILCKRTCGFCRAVAPLSCHATQYGCCWDNLTRSGRNGKGCPPCKDRRPDCVRDLPLCKFRHIQRDCPITCGVQACKKDPCYDDPRQSAYCSVFRDSGFCTSEKKLMKEYCSKTCMFCKSEARPKVIHSGTNTPREATLETQIEEEEEVAPSKKEDAAQVATISYDDESKLTELLKEEALVKNAPLVKKSASRELPLKDVASKKSTSRENRLDELFNELVERSKMKEKKDKLLRQLVEKSESGEKKDNVAVKKDTVVAKKDAVVAKEASKENVVAKEAKKESVVANHADASELSISQLKLVKNELEKKTDALLNDLIKETLAEQKKTKKELKAKKDESDSKEIADLEASLLDLLLKERLKKKEVVKK